MIEAVVDTELAFTGTVRGLPTEHPLSLRASIAARAESGLAVHRNNVAAGLSEVMSTCFPVVRRLVGEESFVAAVRRFVALEPPKWPLLLHYGDTFPDFLRRLGNDACIGYVADVADLEVARRQAYHAARAVPLPSSAFAAIPTERLGGLRLSFHPSVVLMQSRFPIVSTWQASQEADHATPRHWRAEAALIARPDQDVQVWRLPLGGFAFLTGLSRGTTIAAAADAAMSDTPAFDLAASLALLLAANIVIAIW